MNKAQYKAKSVSSSSQTSTTATPPGPPASHSRTQQRKHSTASGTASGVGAPKSPLKRAPAAPAIVNASITTPSKAPQQIQKSLKQIKAQQQLQPQQIQANQNQVQAQIQHTQQQQATMAQTQIAPHQHSPLATPLLTPTPLSSHSEEFYPSLYIPPQQHRTHQGSLAPNQKKPSQTSLSQQHQQQPQTRQLETTSFRLPGSPQISPALNFTLNPSPSSSPTQFHLGLAAVNTAHKANKAHEHHNLTSEQFLNQANANTVSSTAPSKFKTIQNRNTLNKPFQPTLTPFNPKQGLNGQQRRQFSYQAHNSSRLTSPTVPSPKSSTSPQQAQSQSNSLPHPQSHSQQHQHHDQTHLTTSAIRRALHTKPVAINPSVLNSPAKFVPGSESTKHAREALGEEPLAKKQFPTPFPVPFSQLQSLRPAPTTPTKPAQGPRSINQSQQQQKQTKIQAGQQYKPQSQLSATILGAQNPLLAANTSQTPAPKPQRRQQSTLDKYSGNPTKTQQKRNFSTQPGPSQRSRPHTTNRHKKQHLPHLFQISSDEGSAQTTVSLSPTRIVPSNFPLVVAQAHFATKPSAPATASPAAASKWNRISPKLAQKARKFISVQYHSLLSSLSPGLSRLYTSNPVILSVHKRTFFGFIGNRMLSRASTNDNRERFENSEAYKLHRPENDQYWNLPQPHAAKAHMTQMNNVNLNMSSAPVFYTSMPPNVHHQEPYSSPILKVPMAKMNANLDYQKQQEEMEGSYQGWDSALLAQIGPDGSLKGDPTAAASAVLVKQQEKMQKEREALGWNVQGSEGKGGK